MYSAHPLSAAILYQKPLKPASERALGNTARADCDAGLIADWATAPARERAILADSITNTKGARNSKQSLRTNTSVMRVTVLMRLATRSNLIGGDLVS